MAEVKAEPTNALAVRGAPPRALARYLATLKPILTSATESRMAWVRYLTDLEGREDLAAGQIEISKQAIACSERFQEGRRALATIPVPTGLESMHRSVDGWLQALAISCEVIARAPVPMPPLAIDRSKEILRDAAARADRFNQARAAAVEALHDAQLPPPKGQKIVASGKEMRALLIALVVALVLAGGAVFALMRFSGTSASPAASKPGGGPGALPPGVERRVFPQADIVGRLRQEIAQRKIAWQDPDVRLIQPETIIVTGRIQGASSSIPVEVELQLGVNEAGRPRLTARKISAVGVQVPPEATDALARRTEEANQILADQIAPGQAIRRLYIENNQLVAEIDVGAAPGKPAAKP